MIDLLRINNQLLKVNEWVLTDEMIELQQFDLTCDDEWKQTLTSTLYMAAMLIGSIVTGRIADV